MSGRRMLVSSGWHPVWFEGVDEIWIDDATENGWNAGANVGAEEWADMAAEVEWLKWDKENALILTTWSWEMELWGRRHRQNNEWKFNFMSHIDTTPMCDLLQMSQRCKCGTDGKYKNYCSFTPTPVTSWQSVWHLVYPAQKIAQKLSLSKTCG